MMKDNSGEMKVCDWKDAIITVAKVLDSTPADKMAAVVGGMADAEVISTQSNLILSVSDEVRCQFTSISCPKFCSQIIYGLGFCCGLPFINDTL